jgi:hypothetical protein
MQEGIPDDLTLGLSTTSHSTQALRLDKMNRRRFLKYAGATAAVVGASALGLNYVSQQSSFMMSPTTSTTLVPRLTTTSASLSTSTESVQLASLQGRLFFDYNGNGVQDGGEPAVAGASVQLKDNVGDVVAEALSNSSGDYGLEDVRAGAYRLCVEADKKFLYTCRSAGEFRPVLQGHDILLDENATVNLGLMEGFLTLPFKRGTEFRQSIYVDLDPSLGVRDWKGGDFTYDGHKGIDYDMPQGQQIVAAAPGTVIEAEDGFPNNPRASDPNLGLREDGNRVIIDHGNGFRSIYAHLHSGLKVDPRPLTLSCGDSDNLEKVERGQVIALSGNTGTKTMGPHLHFQINEYDRCGDWGHPLDPFRDLYYGKHGLTPSSDSVSLWTKDNDPQYAKT